MMIFLILLCSFLLGGMAFYVFSVIFKNEWKKMTDVDLGLVKIKCPACSKLLKVSLEQIQDDTIKGK